MYKEQEHTKTILRYKVFFAYLLSNGLYKKTETRCLVPTSSPKTFKKQPSHHVILWEIFI